MLSKITKLTIIAILSVSFIFIVYLILNPIYIKGIRVLYPIYVKDLNYARNYYQALSSIISIFIGIFGLTLGFYYYFHKIKSDKEIATRERRRGRIALFIDELNKYDDIVNKIINRNVENKKDLIETRYKIIRIYDNYILMLEKGESLLDLKNDDIKTILRVHSFVEQTPLLMEVNFDKLQTFNISELQKIKEMYTELIQEAKRLCYSKLE